MSGNSGFRRRRVFLACTVLLAVGALLTTLWRSDSRRTLIRDIEESGGGYLTAPRGPGWLPNQMSMRLGTDDDLEYVFLGSTEVDDAWLARLEGHDSIRQVPSTIPTSLMQGSATFRT